MPGWSKKMSRPSDVIARPTRWTEARKNLTAREPGRDEHDVARPFARRAIGDAQLPVQRVARLRTRGSVSRGARGAGASERLRCSQPFPKSSSASRCTGSRPFHGGSGTGGVTNSWPTARSCGKATDSSLSDLRKPAPGRRKRASAASSAWISGHVMARWSKRAVSCSVTRESAPGPGVSLHVFESIELPLHRARLDDSRGRNMNGCLSRSTPPKATWRRSSTLTVSTCA